MGGPTRRRSFVEPWQTVLDIDFTTLTPRDLLVGGDGNKTIAG